MALDKTVVPFEGYTNSQILNAVRKRASTDYRARVAPATEASMLESFNAMWDNTPLRNEFIQALVNRIGLVVVKNLTWNNPLKEFKQGLMSYGSTIEEVQVGLVKAKTYDHHRSYLEKEVFGRKVIDVQSSFHTVNREEYYELTVDEPTLRRAFLEEGGVSDFIVNLMSAPAASDEWDEFNYMCRLFSMYYNADGMFTVNVPDVKGLTSDAADSKAALRALIEMAETLVFPSTHYNAAGMPVAIKREDIIIFCTPAFKAAIGVEALAAAFNIEFTDVPGRLYVIPEEAMAITGAQAVMTTKNFFMVADVRLENTSMPNPVGLYQNFWLHHWEIISASRFAPVVLFSSTDPSTVIPEIVTPVTDVTFSVYGSDMQTVTTLERGKAYGVTGSAITDPAGGLNSNIMLQLVGALSPRTYIDQVGNLSIASDEKSRTVIVRATSTDDQEFLKEISYPIVGDIVNLWPNPSVEPDADKDGLTEVTPEAVPAAPTSGANKNKVVIPQVDNIDYKDGATVVSGDTITLTANKTITAVAQTGYEITPGATASWNLVFTA